MSVVYPVPRPAPRPTPQPQVQRAPFLPAAPAADVELPPLVMAPMTPGRWAP